MDSGDFSGSVVSLILRFQVFVCVLCVQNNTLHGGGGNVMTLDYFMLICSEVVTQRID